jgi:hypothetical protein
VPDINKLVKQFTEMQKMMKRMGGMAALSGGKANKKGKPGKVNPIKMAKAMREMGLSDLAGPGGSMKGFPPPGKNPSGIPSEGFPDFRDFR